MSAPDMYDSFSADQAANPPVYKVTSTEPFESPVAPEGVELGGTPRLYLMTPSGEIVMVGKYTLEIRKAYMYYRIERYLIDHPTATRKQAGIAARQAWRNKAAASMKNKGGAERE